MGYITDEFLGGNRRRREAEAATIANQLLNQGAEPDTVNKVVQTYLDTGTYDLPTTQIKVFPGDENTPEHSVQTPLDLKKRKMLLGFDSEKGVYTDAAGDPVDTADLPPNVDPSIQKYHDDAKNGRAYKKDIATGNIELIGPNGRSYDTYEQWNSKAGAKSGGSGNTPEDKLALNQIRIYQKAIQSGDDITPETMAATRSAAEHFGINLDQVDQDPSIMDKLFNREPQPGQPILQYNGTTQGKTLTHDQARAYLQQAGGDKQKARALAKKAGYTF